MKLSIRLFLFILLFIWVVGNFSEIIAGYFPSFSILQFITTKAFSMVCHQNPLKLICIDENCTQLCARCSGIYIGAFFLSTITLFVREVSSPNLRLLAAAIIIIILDIICYNAGLYNYSHWVAALTGVFLGSIAFLYIRNGIEKLLFELK